MDDAAVCGYGMVGQATAKLFGIKKHYDIDEGRSNCKIEDLSELRYIFICLPTPIMEDHTYLVSDIRQIVSQIAALGTEKYFIIRSTVPSGFADSLASEIHSESIVSNPEFLSEATWENDTKFPPFVLIGAKSAEVREKMAGLYRSRIKHAPIIMTDNITAETAKLALNSLFASKVVFSNQIYDYCQKVGANYEKVKEILTKHPYGIKNHTSVWFNEQRGVRGRCLPKDLEAFAYLTESPLLMKVKEINDEIVNQN